MNQLRHLIIPLLASLLSATLLAQAPEILWTRTYGTAGEEVLYSIDQTTDGGFIMSGTVGFSTGSDDYWLVRTNAQGDTLWTRTYGNPGENNRCRSGQLTNDGGYIMAGLGTMWLIKTNADGDTSWTRRSGGPGGEEPPWVEQTADNGYIITGNINGDVGLIKTDPLGNTQWTKTYGGTGDEYGRSVQQTTDGGYIIVADKSVNQGPVDIWLLKTDANGDTTSTWTSTFATGSDGGSDVVRQTADGGYAIFGIIFGTLESPAPEGEDRDWLLIKTEGSGDLEWDETYGGDQRDQSMGMLLMDDGGFLLTGWLDLTASGNSMDLWLVRANSLGDTVWTATLGGTGMDIGIGLTQIADGKYAVAGGTGSWGAGGLDGWLVRFGTSFEQDSLALVALYNSTGGASWSTSTNWLTTVPLSDWYGVTVSGGRVTALDLHENNLSGPVPVEIGDLSALTSLKLYRNQLTSIPEEIGSLTSLTELWLMENDLTTVPAGIGGLVNLEDLQLSENQLTDLPAEIGDLVSLESLSLFENPFTAIPSGIFDLTTLAQLDLYECEIAGAVPAGIGDLINLTHLSLYTNQLDSIPAEIGNLINLSYLDLANNLLASIPPEIGDLASLTDLRLNGNELDSIPATIGSLTNLEMLYLYGNKLDSLPDQLGNLSELIYLELSDNRLTTLPAWIPSLDTLGWLLMSNNGLTSLPAAIADLAYLNSLNLGNNELEDLPDLSPLDSLTDLRIYGNRLTFDDLEPLMALGIEYIYYDSQDSIGTAVDTTVTIGTSLALGITTGGSANHYEWKKNGAYTVGSDNDTLYFESITESDGGFYNCYITNTTAPDLTLYSLPFNVTVTPLAIDDKPAIPEEYALHANYPNPFNPSTTVRYDLPEAADVILTVYDLLGREVVRLIDGNVPAAYHQVTWNGRTADGREVPTGIYIARLVTPEYTKSIKMVLLR